MSEMPRHVRECYAGGDPVAQLQKFCEMIGNWGWCAQELIDIRQGAIRSVLAERERDKETLQLMGEDIQQLAYENVVLRAAIVDISLRVGGLVDPYLSPETKSIIKEVKRV
jgi:hypothetical protein